MASNKHAANEDEVGKLHNLITKCHNIKAKVMLESALMMEQESLSAEELVMLAGILNTKDLSAAQKWVEYNQVGCLLANEEEGSQLKDRLDAIKNSQKGKVLQFADIKQEVQGGV